MTLPEDLIEAAKAAHKTWGIPASVTLAQWALESSWGKHMPLGSNNPFGMKATGDQPFVVSHTHEVIHGQLVPVIARFRKFASLAEAFAEHAKYLATEPCYAHARAVEKDANAFADALTGVYATDPHYGTLLKGIMKSHDLCQYDASVASRAAASVRSGSGFKGSS